MASLGHLRVTKTSRGALNQDPGPTNSTANQQESFLGRVLTANCHDCMPLTRVLQWLRTMCELDYLLTVLSRHSYWAHFLRKKVDKSRWLLRLKNSRVSAIGISCPREPLLEYLLHPLILNQCTLGLGTGFSQLPKC